MFIKIALLLIFFAITVSVGIYCIKHSTNTDDFVLAGRNIGPWMGAFAYGTTYFSAVVFVGYAGQFGWNFGLSAAWIGIGNALIGSYLAWVVLGNRTLIMTKHLKSATMPDYLSKRYESPKLKIISSFVIFVFLVPYSASVYKGLSQIFSEAFKIDFIYCILFMAILTGFYVTLGGYTAVALNDLIQGVIMLIGITSVIIVILNSKGGLFSAIDLLGKSGETEALSQALISPFGPDPWLLFCVVILTSLGTWGLPQMVHKFYVIKDNDSIKKGKIISTLFALFVAGGSYFLGSFGRIFYTPTGDKVYYDNIVPTMISETLPDFLIGVVIVMVLSASMSTLSALVLSSSSTVTLDFLAGTLFKNMKKNTEIIVIKVFILLFVILSVVLALNPNNLITNLMSLSWGTLAGAFLGPFLYGLYFKKTTKFSVYFTIFSSIAINSLNLIMHWASPPVVGAITILLSLVYIPVFSFFAKEKGHAIELFKCFERQE